MSDAAARFRALFAREQADFLARCTADEHRTARLADAQCPSCYYGRWLAGQAFTAWTCQTCGVGGMHGNTRTPRLCSVCATARAHCRFCGGPVHAATAETAP